MYQSFLYGKIKVNVRCYVACLWRLAIYGSSILLVWCVLQHTERLFILFCQSW